MAAMAEIHQPLQFGENLRHPLGARHATVELDDVAEFAVERATARELHADEQVILEVDEVPARDRRRGHVGLKLGGIVATRAHAGTPVADEIPDDVLDLAEHAEVGALVDLGPRSRIGSADANSHFRLTATLDDLDRVVGLGQHAPGHDDVGPSEVGVGQFARVAVDEAEGPVLRQHGGQRQQAEWRRGCQGAGDLAGVLQRPERVGIEPRKHEQAVAGGVLHHNGNRVDVAIGSSSFG